jgi:DNA polymerase-3 subunit alpha
MAQFTHLHVHSHYSLLDGMSTIQGLVNKCLANGMQAMALTDHGNMFGSKEFFDYSGKKNGAIKGEISELKKRIKAIQSNPEEEQNLEQAIKDCEDQIEVLEKKLFKPILGCEVYVARRSHKYNNTHPERTKEDLGGWHLILLAKNKEGYQNLCKLISISWIDGEYSKPRVDKELLERYHEGLIACSACLGGEISQKIMGGKYKVDDDEQAPDSHLFEGGSYTVAESQLADAEKAIEWYKSIFGDDFYIEMQRHQTDKYNADKTTYEKQKMVNEHLVALARKTNTKIIASNDVHFVEEEHAEAHDRLICLSTSKDLDDPKRMRYTKQEWLKTPEEMAQVFADLPEALENTLEIADKVEFYSINSDPLMPVFPIPEEFGTEKAYKAKFSEEELRAEFNQEDNSRFDTLGGYEKVIRIKLEADYLEKLTIDGAKLRYGDPVPPKVLERIEFELKVMKTMGYPGYFLIVQDFIRAAREMNVSVGPGRGSAAGSAAAYCLKITDIDPLKYDLLFERFLNPDRISMPDIDIDFDDDGRGEVLRWVTEKYGRERVAHIITYGTMATKGSIKDVARVQKLPLPEAERLTKLIPNRFPEDKDGKAPDVNIRNCVERVAELKEALNSDDKNLSDTLKYAEMLEGTVRQVGIHACGVIIGSDDLTNFLPLSTAKDKDTGQNVLVTQYEGGVIEDIGLIKMDFLGLKTLSIIKETLKGIKKSRGIDIDIDRIPIDDEPTYQLYSRGETVGTFQFESDGMRKYLKELKPTQFEDLIAMNALYRPGPMDYIPQFVARKHGRKEIEYDISVMEEYLKDTYGITVYQEQVMLLSRLLANFTRGESDALRKAMGKKVRAVLDQMKPKFIAGGQANGHDPVVLEKIWGDWEKFASYAFNKSHATCYSWISYQTAYLKAHYPGEFMAANLTRNKDNISEITKFMDECKSIGIRVLGPDVNESDLNFTTNKAGNIRFGLGGVKGVGGGAVEAIVREREKNGPFTSVFDFIERVNLNTCNRKNVESLALAGAFDSFSDISREQFFAVNAKGEQVSEVLMRYGNKVQSDKMSASVSLFGGFDSIAISKPDIPKVDPWSSLMRLDKERELVGIYLSAHPLDEFSIILNYVCTAKMDDFKNPDNLKNKELSAGGIVTAVRHGTTKTGNPFGIMTVEDFSGSHEFPFFGKDYVEYGKYLQNGFFLFFKGKYQPKQWSKNQEDFEFRIGSISLLPEVKDKLVEKISIQIPEEHIDEHFIADFVPFIKNNQGKVLLYLKIREQETGISVDLFSRMQKISVNNELIHFLQQKKEEEYLDFKIN